MDGCCERVAGLERKEDHVQLMKERLIAFMGKNGQREKKGMYVCLKGDGGRNGKMDQFLPRHRMNHCSGLIFIFQGTQSLTL